MDAVDRDRRPFGHDGGQRLGDDGAVNGDAAGAHEALRLSARGGPELGERALERHVAARELHALRAGVIAGSRPPTRYHLYP